MKKGEKIRIEKRMKAKVTEVEEHKTGDSRAREEENAGGVWMSGHV